MKIFRTLKAYPVCLPTRPMRKKWRKTAIVLRNHDEKMSAFQKAENEKNLKICKQMMPWLEG